MIPKNKKALNDELCIYLSELQKQHNETSNWLEKDILMREINAVKHLLGIEYTDSTFLSRAKKLLFESET